MENIMVLQAQHYVMNDVKMPLLLHNPNNQSSMQYTPQINIPTDALDKIIAYGSNKDRKNLKESCKQLAHVTSINRLKALMIHDFNIGDETEKTILFKAIITSNNPELITTIIRYAQKETKRQLQNSTLEAICITIDTEEEKHQKTILTQKETLYIKTHYINPLLKIALEHGNQTMIGRVKKENYDLKTIQEYNDKVCEKKMCFATSTVCGTIGLAGVAGLLYITVAAIQELIICSNVTLHCLF
jgi:hypothetical protein